MLPLENDRKNKQRLKHTIRNLESVQNWQIYCKFMFLVKEMRMHCPTTGHGRSTFPTAQTSCLNVGLVHFFITVIFLFLQIFLI